jgi:hypothetical protein
MRKAECHLNGPATFRLIGLEFVDLRAQPGGQLARNYDVRKFFFYSFEKAQALQKEQTRDIEKQFLLVIKLWGCSASECAMPGQQRQSEPRITLCLICPWGVQEPLCEQHRKVEF